MISGALVSQTISGLLLLFVTIYFLYVYFVKNNKSDPYMIIFVILVLSIAYGIHGIAHYQMESQINEINL